jgi:hypothetical protein
VNHELRTPLTAILGWSEVLAEDRPDPGTQKTAVEQIRRSAEFLLTLISDLLDLSRYEEQGTRLSPATVDVGQLVRDAVEPVAVMAEGKGIAITVTAPPLGSTSAKLDPVRMKQVLWNLVHNAVKFTPRHGRIDVDARRDDTGTIFTVSDDGVGIDPKDLPYIFDRFRGDKVPRARTAARASGSRSPRPSWSCTAAPFPWRATPGRGASFRSVPRETWRSSRRSPFVVLRNGRHALLRRDPRRASRCSRRPRRSRTGSASASLATCRRRRPRVHDAASRYGMGTSLVEAFFVLLAGAGSGPRIRCVHGPLVRAVSHSVSGRRRVRGGARSASGSLFPPVLAFGAGAPRAFLTTPLWGYAGSDYGEPLRLSSAGASRRWCSWPRFAEADVLVGLLAGAGSAGEVGPPRRCAAVRRLVRAGEDAEACARDRTRQSLVV